MPSQNVLTEEEFYNQIPQWIGANKESWNHITLFAYFCHKYEEKHGVRFKMVRSKRGPALTKETRDFSKLFKLLAPERYDELDPLDKKGMKKDINVKIYNYINWMFDYKFRSGDRSINGTQLFLLPSMINEFERMYSSFLMKKKEALDFNGILSWIRANHPEILDRYEISDVSDVKMFIRSVEASNKPPESSDYKVYQKIISEKII